MGQHFILNGALKQLNYDKMSTLYRWFMVTRQSRLINRLKDKNPSNDTNPCSIVCPPALMCIIVQYFSLCIIAKSHQFDRECKLAKCLKRRSFNSSEIIPRTFCNTQTFSFGKVTFFIFIQHMDFIYHKGNIDKFC